MILPTFEYEKKIWSHGYKNICGIDEVGLGALAGPMFCAGVILNSEIEIKNVRDSKLLSEKQREEVFEEIRGKLIFKTAFATANEIDSLGLVKAKALAFRRLVESLISEVDYLLLDGRFVDNFGKPASYIEKGDQKSFSIAAASIMAKVTRDRIMKELHLTLPDYGFEAHKGYGTKFHLEALREYGPSIEHRKCYGPVKALLKN